VAKRQSPARGVDAGTVVHAVGRHRLEAARADAQSGVIGVAKLKPRAAHRKRDLS
jgi:hypothetical protein